MYYTDTVLKKFEILEIDIQKLRDKFVRVN